jgi:hypothetical protein
MREEAISPATLLERIGRGEALAVLDVRSLGEFAARVTCLRGHLAAWRRAGLREER